MPDNPYDRFGRTDLILRDELAIDRTLLANERTLLSYMRGSVTLIIAGVTLAHFVDSGVLRHIGLALAPAGIVAGAVGVGRYVRMNRWIRSLRESLNRR
jgi:putative membrane protein